METGYTNADIDRWYLLDTDLDESWPWSTSTEVYVYSIARVMGSTPNREWLVYAYSPRQDRSNVTITIPDYPDTTITVDVTQEGGFYHYVEGDPILARRSDKATISGAALGDGWEQYPGTSNIWMITGISGDPIRVWDDNTYMTEESDTPSLDANKEYFWTTAGDDTLAIYSDVADTVNVEYGDVDYLVYGVGDDYVTMDGINLDKVEGRLALIGGDYWTVKNCVFSNSGRYDAVYSYSDGIGNVFDTCEFIEYYIGLRVDGGQAASGVVVKNCIFRNGRFWNRQSLDIDTGGAIIAHNVFYHYNESGSNYYPPVLLSDSSADNTVIRNNIIITNDNNNCVSDPENNNTGTVVENNVLYNAGSGSGLHNVTGTNNITDAPALVDTTLSGLDFRLTADSPGIDKGKPVFVPYDADGNLRETMHPDIGAYEYMDYKVIYEMYEDIDLYEDLDLKVDVIIRGKRIHRRKVLE
jgi:hypothetical protein